MRSIFLTAVIALGVVTMLPAFGEQPAPLRVVLSCPLAGGGRATLKAISRGYEADELFVEINGKTERAFLDMPNDEFLGQVALSSCVHNTLIFALEYGPPYLKGVAIRSNLKTRTIEHLYFSEKALPRWLYLSDDLMQIIIPNVGFEVSKKYIVYEYISGKGQPEESTSTDMLPESRRKLIEIPAPKHHW